MSIVEEQRTPAMEQMTPAKEQRTATNFYYEGAKEGRRKQRKEKDGPLSQALIRPL